MNAIAKKSRDGWRKSEDSQTNKNVAAEITITPKKVTLILLTVIVLLLMANLAIIYLRFVRGYEHLRGFIHGFYFDAEANFPSLYSTLAILLCARLLWIIGSLDKEKVEKRSFHWKLLSIVFVFLALDEFGSLHEYLIKPMNALVADLSHNSDYLYFAWFVPYAILVLVIGFTLLRFLFRIPTRTRILFISAGVCFLLGAVVMEMIGGNYWASQGWAIDGSDDVDLTYALMTTLEELLEMLGILIFANALMHYYMKSSCSRTYTLRISGTNLG